MNNNLLRKLAVFSIIGGIFQIVATFGFGYQYLLGHDTMGVAVIVGLINVIRHDSYFNWYDCSLFIFLSN